MDTTRPLEFFIGRDGGLTLDGALIGRFGSVDAAADLAVRFAQDQGRLYSLFYPL